MWGFALLAFALILLLLSRTSEQDSSFDLRAEIEKVLADGQWWAPLDVYATVRARFKPEEALPYDLTPSMVEYHLERMVVDRVVEWQFGEKDKAGNLTKEYRLKGERTPKKRELRKLKLAPAFGRLAHSRRHFLFLKLDFTNQFIEFSLIIMRKFILLLMSEKLSLYHDKIK